MNERYTFVKMIPDFGGNRVPEDFAINDAKRAMAEELVERFSEIKITHDDFNGFTIAKAVIEVGMPEKEKRKKGEWKAVPRYDGDKQPEGVCPFCNHHTDYYGLTNYCPNCGADLRE